MRFEYKETEKKGYPFFSIRDTYENKLVEVTRKEDQVEIVTYVQNFNTTKFTMPLELFEKLNRDLKGKSE